MGAPMDEVLRSIYSNNKDISHEAALTRVPQNSFTMVAALHACLPNGPSKYHNPSFKEEEEEILQHFKEFSYFCNVECKDKNNPKTGKEFFDLDDALYFDLMTQVPRGGFEKHYDVISQFLPYATSTFEDLEVFAVSKDFGYSTTVERHYGTSPDGKDFDFRFRLTSLLRKSHGKWKFIHEHFSFPVDMETQKADFQSGAVLARAVDGKK